MSSLFLISFLVYLVSLAFSDGTLSYRLLILFRDLLILAAVSQLFNYIKKSAILILVAAIAIYGLIQFAGFRMLYNTFPEVKKSALAVDDAFELLVETRDGKIPESYAELIKRYDLTVEPAFHPADPSLSRLDEFVAIGIPDLSEKDIKKIIRRLISLRHTLHVEYNEVIQLEIRDEKVTIPHVTARHVNDPLARDQWGWDAIQGDALHEVLKAVKPKKRALIAIVDSGVDAIHEDIAPHYTSSGANHDNDPLGHGTHCAGIAGAVSNNGLGIASLVPGDGFVQITGIKVLNALGVGTQQAIISGIIKAADMGADVISLSLGGPSSDAKQRAYEEAVKYANEKGAVVIAAAGNNNANARDYAPANTKGIITVSAVGPDLRKAEFSNSVQTLHNRIAAPGVNILSTYPKQQYKSLNGTSMATPMVAGLAGILKSLKPDLTTKQLWEILHESGKPIPDGDKTGILIQAANAIEMALK